MGKKQRPTFDSRRTVIVAPGREVRADRTYTEGQVFPWRKLSISLRRVRLIFNQKKLTHPPLEEDPLVTINEPEQESANETVTEEVINEPSSEEVKKAEVIETETVEQVNPEPKPKAAPKAKPKSKTAPKTKAKVEESSAEPDQVVDGSKPWESLPKE